MNAGQKEFVEQLKNKDHYSISLLKTQDGKEYDRVIGVFNKNEPVSLFTLTKEELTNPLLKQCIEQGLLEEITREKFGDFAQDARIVIKCADTDLAFNQDEAMQILENREALRKIGGEIVFEETVCSGGQTFGPSYVSLYQGSRFSPESELKKIGKYFIDRAAVDYSIYLNKVLVSFPAMMEVNNRLTSVAEQINMISEKNHLSPYEKYLLCNRFVGDLEYYRKDEKVDHGEYRASQSYVETVQKNKGCCVGKAQYLRALLSMVGIKSCAIVVHNNNEYAAYFYSVDEKVAASKISIESMTRSNHVINLVCLEDQKYGVSGVFAADAVGLIAPSFIPLEDNLSLFNYVTVYGSEGLKEVLENAQTTKEHKDKSFDDFEAAIREQGDLLKDGVFFDPSRHERALEICSLLRTTKFADDAVLQREEEIKRKIDHIYSSEFIKRLVKLNEYEIDVLKAFPDFFWGNYETIGEGAFDRVDITTLNIPNTITTIENSAFFASRIDRIRIPESVKSIGNGIFSYCWNLCEIDVDEKNPHFKSEGNCLMTKNGKLLIAGCVLSKIPNTVEVIDELAFEGVNLPQIKIPSSVKQISEYAFNQNRTLAKIELPFGFLRLKEGAFNGCDSLNCLIIPCTILYIGPSAIANCPSLTHITVEYQPGKYVVIPRDEFYFAAGVQADEKIGFIESGKMRENIKERVACGALKSYSKSQLTAKRALRSIVDTLIMAGQDFIQGFKSNKNRQEK